MEGVFKEALRQINVAIEFLEKVKVDKKLRKEKDELLDGLKSTVSKSHIYITPAKATNGSSPGGGDVYNDVEQQSGEVYDDVNTGGDNQTYNDNAQEDDVYEDTANDAKSDSKPLPSPNKDASAIAPTPCEELHDATLGEILQVKKERTLFSSGWNNRWCVLHHHILYIYESSKDKKQEKAIDLHGYVIVVREDITRESKRKDRCFELKNEQQKKVFDFCAPDKESMIRWKNKLLQTNVVVKDPDSQSDTSSMKSDNTDHENTSKSKPFFPKVGLKSKKSKTSASDLPPPSDDLYTDTVAEDNYADTAGGGEALYNDTDTPVGQSGDVYDETEGETYEPFDEAKPPPPVPSGKRNLPPPPVSLSPMGGLPPLPSPGPKPASYTDQGPRDTPQLPPPRTPAGPGRGSNAFPLPVPPKGEEPDVINSPSGESRKDLEEDYENAYQGVWDCSGEDDTELSFKRGDIMQIISREYDNYGWWVAKKNDIVGIVPRDYLIEAYEM